MEMHETEAQNDDLPQIFAVGQPVDGQHTFNRRDFLKAAAAATVAGAALAACGGPKKVDPPAATLSPDEVSEQCSRLYAHKEAVKVIVFTPDGQTLISGGKDEKIKFWALPNGALLKAFDNKQTVNTLCVTPDGSILASNSGKEIKLWSIPEQKSLKTLKGHDEYVDQLYVSPDGTRLVSTDENGGLAFWSLPEGDRIAIQSSDSLNPVMRLVITQDNRHVIARHQNGGIRMWSLSDGAPLHVLNPGETGAFNDFDITPDGTRIITGDAAAIKTWSLPEGESLATLTEHEAGSMGAFTWIRVTPDGQKVFALDRAGAATAYLLDGGVLLGTRYTGETNIRELVITPDSNTLIIRPENIWLIFWSISDHMDDYETRSTSAYALTSDFSTLMAHVSGTMSGSLSSESLATGEQQHSTATSINFSVLKISPDDRFVVGVSSTALEGGRIQAWSVPDCQLVACFVDMEANSEDNAGVEIEVEGRTYTQPCGAPIPAGATCTCNCVAGSVCSCVGHRSSGSRGGSSSYWYPN